MKYFVLCRGKQDTDHVFTGKQPRRAALKAATRGYTDIRLRERGTKKIHVFKGSRKKVRSPADRPSWLPATVWKPVVRKVGIEYLEPPRKKRAVKKRRATKRKVAKRKTTKRRTVRRKKATKKRTTKRRTTRRRRR
jgi:hypothetical protein